MNLVSKVIHLLPQLRSPARGAVRISAPLRTESLLECPSPSSTLPSTTPSTLPITINTLQHFLLLPFSFVSSIMVAAACPLMESKAPESWQVTLVSGLASQLSSHKRHDDGDTSAPRPTSCQLLSLIVINMMTMSKTLILYDLDESEVIVSLCSPNFVHVLYKVGHAPTATPTT